MSNYQIAAVTFALMAAASIFFTGFRHGLWPVAIGSAIALLATAIVFAALHEIIAELKRTNQFLWTAEYDRKNSGK